MKYIISCLLLLLLATAGCKRKDDTDECTAQRYAYIGPVNGPSTGKVRHPIEYNLNCSYGWACSEKGPLEVRQQGDDIYIRATVNAHECVICPSTTMGFEETYYFLTDEPGIYYLHFNSHDEVYETDTLFIN